MMRTRYLSIQTWFTAMLMLFALIPSLAVGFLVSWYIVRSEQQEGILLINEVTSRMTGEIELLIREVENTANLLVADDALRKTAQTLYHGTDKASEIDLYRSLSAKLYLVQSGTSFSGIRVFFPASEVITREKVIFFSLSDLEDQEIPRQQSIISALNGWTSPYAISIPGSQTSIPMISFYREGATYQARQVLIVAIDIAESTLLSILQKNESIAGTFTLTDKNNEQITSVAYPAKKDRSIHTVRMTAGNWTLEAAVPLSQFNSSSLGIWLIVLTMLFICVLLIPVLAALVSRRPSGELHRLEIASEKAMEGNFEEVRVDGTNHEIRMLQMAFNALMGNIDRLIHDVYEARIKQHEARIGILFEQIRPHFLYNTLESAKWLAAKNQDEETMEFLGKLAQFFRLGLSGGEDFVPLCQELRHVRLYMELMASRTGHHVIFSEDIPERMMKIRVMKLLLQPIVENAIEHGILQTESQSGEVAVSARLNESVVEITVSDNGVGIAPEKLAEINRGSGTGFGMYNVRERMKLYYGDNASIEFTINEKGGTSVRICFPEKSPDLDASGGVYQRGVVS